MVIDPSDESVYVATGTGLFKSEDDVSWQRIRSDRDIQLLSFDPLHPSRLLAGSPSQLLFSDDGGLTWSTLPRPDFGNRLDSLAFDPSNPMLRFVSAESGTFRSLDGGQNWKVLQDGLRTTVGRSVCVDPTNPLNIYAATARGEMRSIDGGLSWDDIATEIELGPFRDGAQPARKLLIHPANPRIILSARGSNVHRSSKGGRSWSTTLSNVDEVVRTLAWAPSDPNWVYAGTGNLNALYRSRDGGLSWSFRGRQLDPSIDALAVDPLDPMTVYAGGLRGLFKSSDGGSDWQPLTQGLPDSRIHSLLIDPSMNQVVYAGTSDSGVFKSIDGGETWSSLGGPSFTIIRSLAIDPQDTQRIWAGSWGQGVFFSPDGGQSWSSENQGLENPFVWELSLDPWRRLYASGLGGFAVLPLDGPPLPAPFLEARMEVSGSAFAGGLLIYAITLINSGQPGQADLPQARFVASFSPHVEVVEARSDSGLIVIGPADNSVSWEGSIGTGQPVVIEVRAIVQGVSEGEPISALGQLSMDNDADGDFESSVASSDPSSAFPGGPTTIAAQESFLDTELLAVPYQLGIDSTFVGLAMVNFDDGENGIEFLALDGQGQVEDQLVEESVLPQEGQFPFLTSEIFTEPTDTLAVRGTEGALSGFFMLGDLESNRLDGLGAALTDSPLLFFTEVRSTSDTSTHFYFFNSDPLHEALATLKLFAPDGMPLGESEVALAPFGSIQASLAELFGPLLVEDGYIRLEASRPVRGFELLADADRFAALPAQPPVLTEQMWAPHFFWNDQGGTSLLRFLNPGSQSVEVSIRMRNNRGALLAQSVLSVPPDHLEVFDVKDHEEIAALESGEGSIEVSLQANSLGPFPVLSPFQASITYDGGVLKTLSSLPLLKQLETQSLFLQVAHSFPLEIFQGVAILNPTPEFITVFATAFDSQGEQTGFRFLRLRPRGRFVGLLDDPDLFGEGFEQVGGFLEIRSSRGLFASYVLFGGPRTLSALQGRPSR